MRGPRRVNFIKGYFEFEKINGRGRGAPHTPFVFKKTLFLKEHQGLNCQKNKNIAKNIGSLEFFENQCLEQFREEVKLIFQT